MLRLTTTPRENYEDKLKEVGFDYFNLPSSDGTKYWQEGVFYEFNSTEIDLIDDAAQQLHDMCMQFVEKTISEKNYYGYNFSEETINLIEDSWNRGDKSLIGRFDLAFDPLTGSIKMLEYNADTPTSLLEASIVQWNWLQDVFRGADQFNSIHEKLFDRFQELDIQTMTFVAAESAGREDWGNLHYLMDVAAQCNIQVQCFNIEDIGVLYGEFVDLDNTPIKNLFKLYPWEWIVEEQFSQHLKTSSTTFHEPAWKMLLSNKALLPKLWQMFPNHCLLLESHFLDDRFEINPNKDWVKKPLLSREGANVTKITSGIEEKLSGSDFNSMYDSSGYIIQEWFDLPEFNDPMYNRSKKPIIGAWIIGDKSAGIGIREDFNSVTGNDSHFIPHLFY